MSFPPEGVWTASEYMSERAQPEPTIFDPPLRTVVAEFKDAKGLPIWRILEEPVDLRDLSNHQKRLAQRAFRLVSFFQNKSGMKPTENMKECELVDRMIVPPCCHFMLNSA